jgi:hypothetical protein
MNIVQLKNNPSFNLAVINITDKVAVRTSEVDVPLASLNTGL